MKEDKDIEALLGSWSVGTTDLRPRVAAAIGTTAPLEELKAEIRALRAEVLALRDDVALLGKGPRRIAPFAAPEMAERLS